MAATALRVPLARVRLGRLADDTLAQLVATGDERAFEELYDRHHAALLGFCRHMLGTREEAEDALQQTFLRAHRALVTHGAPDDVRPWLFAIARNRCRSMYAARKDSLAAGEEAEPVTDGLSAGLEQRADLRALLADIAELPEDQRSALVLAELADMPHTEIAAVIGVPAAKVKALVHQARTHLIAEREARETPCEQIREQLANARGGELRRGPLRRHLNRCEPCSAYRRAIAQQRVALGLVLPVIPSAGLKDTILGAIYGGGGGGAAAAAGAAGAASVGAATSGAAGTASVGAATSGAGGAGVGAGALGLGAKLAVGAALLGTAGGGAVVAGRAVIRDTPSQTETAAVATAHPRAAKAKPVATEVAGSEHPSGTKSASGANGSSTSTANRDGARGDVASRGKRQAHAYGKTKNAAKGRRSHGDGAGKSKALGKSKPHTNQGANGKAVGRSGAPGSHGATQRAAVQQRNAQRKAARVEKPASVPKLPKPAAPVKVPKPPKPAVPVKQKPATPAPTATPAPVPTAVPTPKNTGQSKKAGAGSGTAQP
jgi:RNA polymerase sigma factor (sigma-70 family)